jgi:hypothetical protein
MEQQAAQGSVALSKKGGRGESRKSSSEAGELTEYSTI